MVRSFLSRITALVGILLLLPIIGIALLFVWLEDHKNPIYIAKRVGRGEIPFSMYKIRSMRVTSSAGPLSTSSEDPRISRVGKYIRRFKLDELSQLLNVLFGDMNFVGPRPNVFEEVDLYTGVERRLLSVRPGITDFASIVFSDEGRILSGSENPDLTYNQLIRPYKSQLGLFYIDNNSLVVDIIILALTVVSIFSRKIALRYLASYLRMLGAPECLVLVASRTRPLKPAPPPGSSEIVVSR